MMRMSVGGRLTFGVALHHRGPDQNLFCPRVCPLFCLREDRVRRTNGMDRAAPNGAWCYF